VNLTLEVDHEWQASILRDLAALMTAENPIAGEAKSAIVLLNLKFDAGSSGGLLGCSRDAHDPELEVAQLIHLGALALSRVGQIVASAGGGPEEIYDAGQKFLTGVAATAASTASQRPPTVSRNVDEAIAKARQHFHNRSNPR